jgi:hypothetical protein
LRGAFAKRNGPGTPVLGPRGRATSGGAGDGDLIELENTNSDDGNGNGNGLGDLLGHEVFGPTGWSAENAGTVRGRTSARTPGTRKNSKGD